MWPRLLAFGLAAVLGPVSGLARNVLVRDRDAADAAHPALPVFTWLDARHDLSALHHLHVPSVPFSIAWPSGVSSCPPVLLLVRQVPRYTAASRSRRRAASSGLSVFFFFLGMVASIR
jgi:hypothetical protein